MFCYIEAQLKCLKVDLRFFHKQTEEIENINEQQLMECLYTQKRLETLELTTRETKMLKKKMLNICSI